MIPSTLHKALNCDAIFVMLDEVVKVWWRSFVFFVKLFFPHSHPKSSQAKVAPYRWRARTRVNSSFSFLPFFFAVSGSIQ